MVGSMCLRATITNRTVEKVRSLDRKSRPLSGAVCDKCMEPVRGMKANLLHNAWALA